jgi:Holliday junction resolvase RusA-like endonuclease
VIAFTVYGTAIQKGSARAFYIEKLKRAVVTSDTRRGLKEWENIVRHVAQGHAGRLLLLAVSVSLDFYLPRPVSLPKKVTRCTKKPDIDKLARSVLDALTGVIWKDDSQVVQMIVFKRYQRSADDAPHLDVTIEELVD